MFDELLLALLLLSAAGAYGNVPGLTDPTRPLRPAAAVPATPGAALERPSLESVLIGGSRRVAVINGRRMTEGDELGGVKVWTIRPDGVVVSVNGTRMTLSIANSRMHKELR